MRWFREHPKITTVIITLLVLLIVFYISLLSVGKNNFLGNTLGNAVVSVQKVFTTVGNAISGKVVSFTSADAVEKENEELQSRIAELEEELARQKLNQSELKELKQLSKAFDSHNTIEEYKPVACEIVSYDGSNVFNVFTVNAGSESGIKVNNAVINDQGLIGRVISAGKNNCKIIAVIDEANKVGFQLGKNLRYRGVCQGDGNENLSGYFFNTKSPVKEGDAIVTSGIGGIYPAGLKIGTVSEIDNKKNSPLKEIVIDPVVSFDSIRKVAVLTGYAGE